jgi:hypothetical protein
MVSVGSYMLSAVLLTIVAGSIGFSAFRIRRHVLPSWDGAPARLVELVIGIALLTWLCELLGVFGLLYSSMLVIEALLLACAILAWPIGARASKNRPTDAPSPPPQAPRGMTAVALAVVFVVFAHWGLFTKYALDYGVSNFDSLSTYMPFATSMVQNHSVIEVNYVNTSSTSWLLPQTAVVLHAVAILLTDRDTLSLFINFGWLALAFLAAWCVGRPYGRGPLAVVGAAIVLESSTLIVRNPGTAKDDVMAAALLLAAIAILLNARLLSVPRGNAQVPPPGWPLAAAGLAAGLAMGTKATVFSMVAALSVAVIVATPRGRRMAAAGWWFLPALAGGGFWYLRNLLLVGNPIPQASTVGPIPLPYPHQLQEELPAFSILHYATDTAVWREYFGPGLEVALGTLWPLVIGGAIAGALHALLQDRDRALRWIGGIALLGGFTYLATPLTAAGPEGYPFQFYINVRYAAPALLIGLVILPLARGLSTTVRMWALLVAFVVVLWITNGADAILQDPNRGFGLLLATVAVVIPVLILLLLQRWGASNRELAFSFAILAMLVVIVGYPLQRDYLHNRFGPASGFPGQEMNSAYLWARDVSDAHIGIVGTTAGFYQYGLYGTDLSNEVTYVGERGAHAAFNPIQDCQGFREAVDDTQFDYLITSPFLNFLNANEPVMSPEAAWLRGSPGVEAVDTEGLVTVWRVNGSLNPAGCGPQNAPLHSIPQQPGI